MVFQPMNFQAPALPLSDPYGAGQQLSEDTRYRGAMANDIQNRNTPQMLHEKLRGMTLANELNAIKAKYGEPLSQQKLLSSQLANQLSQATLPYAGEKEKALLEALKLHPDVIRQQMQMNQFKLDNPLLNLSGAAGQVGAIDYLNKIKQAKDTGELPQETPLAPPGAQGTVPVQTFAAPPAMPAAENAGVTAIPVSGTGMSGISPNQPMNQPTLNAASSLSAMPTSSPGALAIANALTAQTNQKHAQSQLAQMRAQGYSWQQMPSDYKQVLLAQAAQHGYDPLQAEEYFKKGGTLENLTNQEAPKQSDEAKRMQGSFGVAANKKIAGAQMTNRAESAVALHKWLMDNRKDYAPRLASLAKYAGMAGQTQKGWDAIKKTSPDAYQDYLWFKSSFVPNLINQVKMMEKMGSTDTQRQELHDMLSRGVSAIDVDPVASIQLLNRAIKTMFDVGGAVIDAAEPVAKGAYKNAFGLTDTPSNYVSSHIGQYGVSDKEGHVYYGSKAQVDKLLKSDPSYKAVPNG